MFSPWHFAVAVMFAMPVGSGAAGQDISLLDGASKIRLPAAQATARHGDSCQWLSDHELLLRRQGKNATADDRWYRYDIASGKETFLARLSQLVLATGGSLHGGTYKADGAPLSPDGKWLLWYTGRSYWAATVDGFRTREWRLRAKRLPERPLMCWSGTSNQWLALIRSNPISGVRP